MKKEKRRRNLPLEWHVFQLLEICSEVLTEVLPSHQPGENKCKLITFTAKSFFFFNICKPLNTWLCRWIFKHLDELKWSVHTISLSEFTSEFCKSSVDISGKRCPLHMMKENVMNSTPMTIPELSMVLRHNLDHTAALMSEEPVQQIHSYQS